MILILNTYINIGDHLLMCDGVVSEQGEVVKVTSSDKLILAFMAHRMEFFINQQGRECFDSMEFIALRTGVTVKTVERCISKFTKSGILAAEKRFDYDKKHFKWFWLGFKVMKYVTLDGDKIKSFISENMADYNPKPYFKVDKEQRSNPKVDMPEIPDYLSSVPDDTSNYVPEFSGFDYEFEMQAGVM